ncbi:hypothetical protein D3C87_1633400 [compost metagenome]
MLSRKFHLFHVQHFLTFHTQPGFALLMIQVIVTHIDAKTHAALVRTAHRHGQRIVGVHYAHFGIFIDAQFGRTILL